MQTPSSIGIVGLHSRPDLIFRLAGYEIQFDVLCDKLSFKFRDECVHVSN